MFYKMHQKIAIATKEILTAIRVFLQMVEPLLNVCRFAGGSV